MAVYVVSCSEPFVVVSGYLQCANPVSVPVDISIPGVAGALPALDPAIALQAFGAGLSVVGGPLLLAMLARLVISAILRSSNHENP